MDKNNALKLVDRIWDRCEEIEERPTDGYRMLPDITELKEEIRSCSCSRWIPVSERLPTENDAKGINFKILVLFSNGVVDLWNPILVNEHFDLQIKHTYITHWMSLPNPPQEVE